MSLVRYPVVRVINDVRYEGMWFRIEGDDLYVTGKTENLTDYMRAKVKRLKPEIMDALQGLPADCPLPTVHLLIGQCDHCQCGMEIAA